MNTQIKHLCDAGWLSLAKQSKWSVDKMAESFGCSNDTLRRAFFKQMHKTLREWITEQKSYLAVELLHKGISIKEISHDLNYSFQTNFSRNFKVFWGVSPIHWHESERIIVHLEKCRKMIN